MWRLSQALEPRGSTRCYQAHLRMTCRDHHPRQRAFKMSHSLIAVLARLRLCTATKTATTPIRPPRGGAKALLSGGTGAPGRVRTCDPPLRRCPHRVRTSSSVSFQTTSTRTFTTPRTDRFGANCTQNCTHHRALATGSGSGAGGRSSPEMRSAHWAKPKADRRP